ncbi:hypothetical protein KIS4809_3394 [Bacillus sp. ZZV12-4809]|nr:hypothetical protein KIS4809_3394 [Bacillus sp. ZZV12-4809]
METENYTVFKWEIQDSAEMKKEVPFIQSEKRGPPPYPAGHDVDLLT